MISSWLFNLYMDGVVKDVEATVCDVGVKKSSFLGCFSWFSP